LDLPIATVRLEANTSDAGNVHGILSMNADEAEGLEEGKDLTDRSSVFYRFFRPQPDEAVIAGGFDQINIMRIYGNPVGTGEVEKRCRGSGHDPTIAGTRTLADEWVSQPMSWRSGL